MFWVPSSRFQDSVGEGNGCEMVHGWENKFGAE
jgi:hypothetical protein